MSGLVGEYGIDYIKWDHNRDLHEAVRTGAGDGRAGRARADPRASTALLDELRARHPGLEIESCAPAAPGSTSACSPAPTGSGPSDCNDALERRSIQRWTGRCSCRPS